ncbi:MAG: cysteine desulfurase family protein [Christensenellaceae bacterium]|jgi:cysteine desulfurase
MDRIYLDYAATTGLKPEVLEAMSPFFSEMPGNPSGMYASARKAKEALEEARHTVLREIGGHKTDGVYFTSGGTESDNWALFGAAMAKGGGHIVTTAAEHHAVMEACRALEKKGFDITYVPVDQYGMAHPEEIEKAIRKDTVLVSCIYANNEVGTVNPVGEIGDAVRGKGVPFHVDAVQAAGTLKIDVERQSIDLLSVSAHKFYGPKGAGALYVRKGVSLESLLVGGKQERGKRAGTENMPGIVGLASALRMANENRQAENKRLEELREHMTRRLLGEVPGVRLNGHPKKRLPGNVNILVSGLLSEAALVLLDRAGIECSAGSACTSGALIPSHVLLAMGIDKQAARTSLRFTMGAETKKEHIDYTVDTLKDIVKKM